jgi:uncharacterized damage-inducible protein DinB
MTVISFKEVAMEEFAKEMATTRLMLARVPLPEKKEWRPHEKSMTLGALAKHIATLVGMAATAIAKDPMTFGPQGSGMAGTDPADAAALVALFDEKAQEAKAALEGATDERFAEEWELTFSDGTTTRQLFKGSRALAYRSLFMDHLIHHRAQLGVYLRMLDVTIPGSYGPSADEPIQ